MAKGFSFEEALGKPSASQEAPKGFSFEEALGSKPAPVEVETPAPAPAPVPVAEPAEPAPRVTDAGQIDYGFKNTAGGGRGIYGGPTAEELDIDQMSQFRKGVQAGWVGLKSVPANLKLSGGSQAFVNATNRLSMLDKIDSGEITSVRQVRQEPGFNPLIGTYLASGPEVREQIRNQVLKQITSDQDFVKNAIEAVEQYQAEAKKYTGRTEDLTDVRSVKNFGDWLAKASGEGAVQLAPVMLAALTLKAPGVLASSSAMEYGGGVQNRLEFLANRVKNLSPDQKASVVANYIEETDDVTAAAAIMSGSLDVILGPAATAAKMSAKELLAKSTRKGAMKEAAKEAPKDIAGEFTTGGGQEAIQIGSEKELGEQQDVLNMKNVKRVINAAAKEAAGAPTGTAINVAMAGARKPSLDTGKESDLIKGLDKEGEELDKKDKGGQDDAGIVSPAGGAGVQVAGQPGGVPTAAGAGVSEPAGVDVAGQDVAGAEGRISEQPGALTEAELEAAAERESIQTESQQQAAPIDDSDIPDTEFQRKESAPTDVSRGTPAPVGPPREYSLANSPQNTPLLPFITGVNKQLDTFYNNLYSKTLGELPENLQKYRHALDDANAALEFVQTRLAKWSHPAITGKNQGERAAAKAKATAEDRELLDVQSQIAGGVTRLANQAMALHKGYKGKKAGDPRKILAARDQLDADIQRAIQLLYDRGLLPDKEALEWEEEQKRQGIQQVPPTKLEPPVDSTTPAPAPAPAVTEKRVKDKFGNTATEVTLPNGSKYQIQRLNSLESMGLPGWHLAGATVTDIREGAFLGNTKEEAIQELLLRERVRPPVQVGDSTTPPPAEDKPYYGSDEINALGDRIKNAADNIMGDFMVGDMVRYGNTNGVVVGTEGAYARVHPDGAKNPKAYYRVPKTSLELVARPDTTSKTAAMAAPGEDKKFGLEQGKLNADMGGLIQLLGANMYAGTVADVAVKELLQNAFDAVKGAVSDKKAPSLYKSGKITITINDTDRTITVADDARGMTPEIVRNAFFTVAGSDKSDLTPEERSGGLGLAKMGFMLGSERLILDTVRDGVRVRVDTSAQDIANSNFQIVKSPAPKQEHGTTVTVKIPEFYTDPKTGDQKNIYFSGNPEFYDALKQPLIGPVVVETARKGIFTSTETLPVGLNFPADKYIQFKVNFGWGSADIYFSKERSSGSSDYSIKHQVLSSGVYQFSTDFKLSQNEKIPYDIIVNVKPNVEAKHPDYPFENSRERFKTRLKEDIQALQTYLAQIARGNEASDLQENFKNIVSMPRVEAGKETADAANKLRKAFDRRGTGERRELPPMPKEVTVSGTKIIVSDTGKVLADAAKKEEKLTKGTFQAEKEAPKQEDYLMQMAQDPKLPIFHNNTNVDLIAVGNEYGNPEQFFAELGTLMVEMKEAAAGSGMYGYEILKPENLFFAGVSVDKSYGGVHIKVPYKAVLVNPFYDFGAKTLFGVREYLWETMTHEIAHTGDMGHGEGHNAHMLKVRQYFADEGLADYFRDALMDVLTRHESTYTAMREAYGRSTTKNTSKSLRDYEKGAASASDGSAASRDPDSVRPLPAGRGQSGYGDLRAAGPVNTTSGIPRATGSTAPASVKGLHSDVADAINRNDITGAMKAMARNTSGFYSALADRLAALNLPTSIGFNNQRALVRKIIDDRSAQQQLRLFAYLSREAPTFYDQYFKDYDKVENLERVAEGLSLIETTREGFTARNINTAPVATELAAVREAYRRNMPGLTAPGFFAPTLDTVNIRPDRTLGTNNRVVLHEVVHAATEYMLYGEVRNLTQEQQDAVADLNAMYKFAQTKLSPDEYGFTNLSEFVAEVMTNKDFQNKLKAIPYPPRKTTLLGAFKQLIGRMFGFNNLAGAAMSAIDDIMSPQRPTSGVRAGPLKFATSGKKKRVRGPVSKPDTSRTAESVDRTIMDVVSDASQGKQSIGSAISDLKGALWSAGGGAVRTVMLPVLQLRQLKDLTRSKFPQFAGAVRIVEQMVAYRGEKIRTAEEIVKRWGQLQSKSPQQSDLMSRIMIEATIRGRDPDAGVAPGALPDALDNAWNGLDTEFQEIYRDVRQFYADSVEEMVRTMKQRALGLPKAQRQAMIRKINEQFGPKKLAYPYFPLRRFGTHWLQVGKGPYKEFYTFDNPVSRQLAFYQRRRELQGGNAQQRALAETMRMGNGISELFSQNMSATQAIKELEETLNNLTSTDVAGIKEEIKDSMHQLVYLLLPQQSMRKMFINRKAIQGMSSDMLRVFAHSSVHSAYQQARFKYAEPFINNISNARSYIQDMEESKAITPEQGSVYRDYVLELEKRVSNVLGVEDKSMVAKVGNTIASTVFYWMLSAPASALINIVGASQITMPYIGGRYGYAKTNATMLKYLGLYIASTPTRSLAPMAKGQFSQVSFPSIVESGFVSKMDPMIQRAAQRLIADGDINISMTNDIFDLSEMPSALYTGKINTVKKVLSGVFHQAERLNREVSMLTAFELAFERYNGADKRDIRGVVERDSAGNPIKYTPDEAFEKALEDARDIGGLTLGDFSRQMKGRVFQHPGINLITQFKQYAITATYAVLRNFYLTVGAPFKTAEIEQFRKQMIADKVAPAVIEQRIEEAEKFRKEVYREGMKRLAGILGMTFLYGGIAAQPFFNMLGQLIAMFAPDGDDKDEYFDWQNWFYNYMQSEVGGAAAAIFEKMGMKAGKAKDAGEELGMALARGPVAALTGTSLAERVSLDLKNLWWKDLPYSNELKQDFEKAALELLGPFVGLGTNWTQAWDLATKGQYQRAFEKALPAIASKPVTAARLGTEGATDMKGATIMGLYADQFSSWELAMQALGFQPEKLARAMKAASQVKAKEAKIHNERAAILDRLYLERGTDEYADVYEKARDFSIRYPQLKIDDTVISDAFEERDRARVEAEAKGVRIDKKLYPELGPMTNYGWGNR